MESNIGWAFAAVKVKNGEEFLDEDTANRLLQEAFEEDRSYKVILCGAVIDKPGNLLEMETAYNLLKTEMPDYQQSDFAIISEHDEADLLFIPVEEETIQDENA